MSSIIERIQQNVADCPDHVVIVDQGENNSFTYGEFDLYAAAQISATNFAWINNYGPAHYAAYLNVTYGEEAADILAVLEAFYLYGASVEAYVATLG